MNGFLRRVYEYPLIIKPENRDTNKILQFFDKSNLEFQHRFTASELGNPKK